MNRIARSVALVLGLAACGDARTAPDGVPAGARVVATTPVADVSQLSESHSGLRTAERLVVRDAAAWSALWDRVTSLVLPKPTPPAVDFDREMVLVAGLGTRPNGGYAVSFAAVYESDGVYHAVVRESVPGPSCITPAVVTAPVAAVRLPRTAGEVRFVEQRETRSCR
jgi:hypothetical protein